MQPSATRVTKRPVNKLAGTLEKNLLAYIAAASASVIAFVEPAAAEIVYTPANTQVGSTLYIDLNHDGINDFQLVRKELAHCNPFGCSTLFYSAFLSVYGLNGNEVFGQATSASALPNHFQIGSKGKFPGGKKMLEMFEKAGSVSTTFRFSGPWQGRHLGLSRSSLGSLNNRYLGFKFLINGETHFGWARLNVTYALGGKIKATLTGYAYETVPDKPILTVGFTIAENQNPMQSGEQTASLDGDSNLPTLGRLALGAPAVDGWRNRKLAMSN